MGSYGSRMQKIIKCILAVTVLEVTDKMFYRCIRLQKQSRTLLFDTGFMHLNTFNHILVMNQKLKMNTANMLYVFMYQIYKFSVYPI